MARGGMASAATGPDVTPPVVEEESTDVGSTEGQKAPEVEEDIVEEGGLSEPLKECRSKAARDRAPPSDADTRTGEVPSTEAVMRADGATESRHPPPSSLTFTELHTALGEAHVAEIKRLTALVEEAAQKNRKLIALGTEAQAKALAEAREGFVKESFYREAEFRAQQAEEARKRAKAEVAELTKVLEQKGRELEDVIAEYKVKLEAATDARDSARGAAASLREEVAALKQQHAKELAAEKEASEGIVLAVQAEKTNFEAFVREMSRQILGTCDFVETATPRECLSTATARIIACAGEILAALQYLSPREVIPRDTPSVFKAVSNIPAVVDWLRRSSCRVGITMAREREVIGGCCERVSMARLSGAVKGQVWGRDSLTACLARYWACMGAPDSANVVLVSIQGGYRHAQGGSVMLQDKVDVARDEWREEVQKMDDHNSKGV
ncbi:uncharacterized protein [Lolium perenne]|uniref:uncharacterized protein n=1 Tax=Lolium perenne TaxID=4522 RepID=UPI003A992BDB